MSKRIFLLLLLFYVCFLNAQTPDFAASYILREVHIFSAREYSRAVRENSPKYSTYVTNLTTTFVLPRSASPLTLPTRTNQTAQIQLRRANCQIYLSPLKIARCQDRLNVLSAAALATQSILSSPSVYPINNALRVKLEMEAIAIQNLINEYLYK